MCTLCTLCTRSIHIIAAGLVFLREQFEDCTDHLALYGDGTGNIIWVKICVFQELWSLVISFLHQIADPFQFLPESATTTDRKLIPSSNEFI